MSEEEESSVNIETTVMVSQLNEEEKSALNILEKKHLLTWCHGGYRDNYLVISIPAVLVEAINKSQRKLIYSKKEGGPESDHP